MPGIELEMAESRANASTGRFDKLEPRLDRTNTSLRTRRCS